MTLAEKCAEFFGLSQGTLNLYFPGLKKAKAGYELDFHEFADELECITPKMKIRRIGINCDKETVEARKKDLDDTIARDIYELAYDGILFLPRFRTWMKEIPPSSVYCLTKLAERFRRGGIIAYNADEDLRDSEIFRRYEKDVREALDNATIIRFPEKNPQHYLIKVTGP